MMNRRALLQRASALMGAQLSAPVLMALTACTDKNAHLPIDPVVTDSNADVIESVFNPAEREMVEILVELIIPATDTPGASEAGVGGFIDNLVTNWYQEKDQINFLKGLGLLNTQCLLAFQKNFLTCDNDQQVWVLEQAEKDRLGVGATSQNNSEAQPINPITRGPWNDLPKGGMGFFNEIKQLTILGYYTSEIGATQELIYDPVPGSYDGDVDFYEMGRHYTF